MTTYWRVLRLALERGLLLEEHLLLDKLGVHFGADVLAGFEGERKRNFLGEFLQANLDYFLGEHSTDEGLESHLDFLHYFVHNVLGEGVEDGAGHYRGGYFQSHLQ